MNLNHDQGPRLVYSSSGASLDAKRDAGAAAVPAEEIEPPSASSHPSIALFQKRRALFIDSYLFDSKKSDPQDLILALQAHGAFQPNTIRVSLHENTHVDTSDDNELPFSKNILISNVRRLVEQYLKGSMYFHTQSIPREPSFVMPWAANPEDFARHEYLYSHKTDGIRCVLLIHRGEAFLIRRNFEVTYVPLHPTYHAILRTVECLLLDGEMMYYHPVTTDASSLPLGLMPPFSGGQVATVHPSSGMKILKSDQAFLFVSHDIIAIHKRNCTRMPAEKRIQLMIQVVSEINQNKLPSHGLNILFKEYVRDDQLQVLQSEIQTDTVEEGESSSVQIQTQYYIHEGMQSRIHVDGLIAIQPDSKYQCNHNFTERELVKWKPEGKRTADLQIAGLLVEDPATGRKNPWLGGELDGQQRIWAVLQASLPSYIPFKTQYPDVCVSFGQAFLPPSLTAEHQKLCQMFQESHDAAGSSNHTPPKILPLESIRSLVRGRFMLITGNWKLEEVWSLTAPESASTGTGLDSKTFTTDELMIKMDSCDQVFRILQYHPMKDGFSCWFGIMDYFPVKRTAILGYRIVNPEIARVQKSHLLFASHLSLPSELSSSSISSYSSSSSSSLSNGIPIQQLDDQDPHRLLKPSWSVQQMIRDPHSAAPVKVEVPRSNPVFAGLGLFDSEETLAEVMESVRKKRKWPVVEGNWDQKSRIRRIKDCRFEKERGNFHSVLMDCHQGDRCNFTHDGLIEMLSKKRARKSPSRPAVARSVPAPPPPPG